MGSGTSDGQARDDVDEQYDRLRRMMDGWLSENLDPFVKVRAALMAPRSLLFVGKAEMALRLLRHLAEDMLPATPNHRHLYIVLANMAYCHNALGDQTGDQNHYLEAIKLIKRIRRIQRIREEAEDKERAYDSWHAVDLAYSYMRLGDEDQMRKALHEAAEFTPDFEELIPWFSNLHPDLREALEAAHRDARPGGEEDL
jgi:tetratricopeptide (TPR) repeat protein